MCKMLADVNIHGKVVHGMLCAGRPNCCNQRTFFRSVSEKGGNVSFALGLSNMNRFQWKLVGMSRNKPLPK